MGVGNPTSCTVPSAPPSGTGNNGNVMGYFYQDGANSSFGHTTSYSYDHLNRLGTSVATGSATHNLTFSYDRYGNMTCVTNGNTNGPCPNWTFNTATNQISNSGFTYDAAGNLTGDGTHTYQWNAEGRLKTVDSGNTASYTYNALGWRVEKKVGSTYTEVLYDQSGESLGENNRSSWTQSYVNFAGRHLAIYQNNATYFTHTNSLGSTVMVSDYTGAIVEDKLFYPWGQDRQTAGTLYEERFAKLQHRDGETSLDPTPNRMFSSTFGRWLSPDPLGGNILGPQSLNRYAYVQNNPARLTDPLGLDDEGSRPLACVVNGSSGFSASYCESVYNGLFGARGPVNPDLWEIHHRDKPEKPVITNPSQTGTNQLAIQNALNQLLTNLACDPDCLAFLGQKGLDPLQTLKDIIGNSLYGHANISLGGDPNTIAAVSGGVAGQAITVNNQGAFFFGLIAGGLTLTVGPDNILGGSPQAQAFILLHELGHNTAVLRPDLGNPKAGQQNDQDIQNHCKKTIDASD